jgi:hypothetical protein
MKQTGDIIEQSIVAALQGMDPDNTLNNSKDEGLKKFSDEKFRRTDSLNSQQTASLNHSRENALRNHQN